MLGHNQGGQLRETRLITAPTRRSVRRSARIVIDSWRARAPTTTSPRNQRSRGPTYDPCRGSEGDWRMPMDHTSEVLGRLSQRLDEATDDAERALLLGEVVGVFEAVQSTVQPEIRNLPLALARIELGEVLNNLGRQAEAENQLTLALGELEQAPIGPGEEREIARARGQFALGDTYRTTGRASRALAAYGAAVQHF